MTGKFRLGILTAALTVAIVGAATTLVTHAADPTPTPNGTQAGRAWLGVSVAELNDQLAQKLGVSQTTGIVVLKVAPESPAAKAGVQEKDIDVRVEGNT